jgi:hypothetical protein
VPAQIYGDDLPRCSQMRELRLPVARRSGKRRDKDNRYSACAAHIDMQPAGWSRDETVFVR